MKYFFTFFVIGFFLFSCQENSKDYRLDEGQLVNLMLDLQLVETMVSTMQIEDQDSVKSIFWQKLSAVYKLSEEEIRQEVEQLETDPEKLAKIMGMVKTKTDSLK